MRYVAVVLLVAVAAVIGVVVGVVLVDSDDTPSAVVSQASPEASPRAPLATSVPTTEPPATPAPTLPPTEGPTAQPTMDIDAFDLLATALAQTPEPPEAGYTFYLSTWFFDEQRPVEPCGVVVKYTAPGEEGMSIEIWRKPESGVWAQVFVGPLPEQPQGFDYVEQSLGNGTWTYRVAWVDSAGAKRWSHEEEWTIDNPICAG